jgi:DNA-binding transcriptional LysR family regulator
VPAKLDITALRSLLAIADHGGFRRAAEELHLSQSGVSAHVRRLEQVVGRPLVAADGRRAGFTQDGELLVTEARTILAAHDAALVRLGVGSAPATLTVGSTEHAADRLIPALTAVLGHGYPDAALRFRLDRGARLNEGVAAGTVDVAVLLGTSDDVDCVAAGALPLSWFAAEGWAAPLAGDPLPVVAIDEPCTLRRRCLAALGSRTAVVVGEAGHLAGVLHLLRSGMGVALLADVGDLPPGLVRVDGLPRVSAEPLHVRARRGAAPDLAAAVAAAVRTAIA